MRILLGCAILLGLALVSPAAAQKKGDKDKTAAIDDDLLVGKWETVQIKGLKGAKGPTLEFTKDGKCYLGVEGTYKLDGDNLTMTMGGAPGVPADVQKWKIKKLTETDLILVAGKLTETWKRANQEKAGKGKAGAGKDKAAAIDGDLLVGKWESPPVKGIKAPKGPVIEFTKDGNCQMGSPGVYKLDGDKLTVAIKGPGGAVEEHQYTIKKLTKTEMIWYEGKMMTSLRRTK
jgi:uncharacterized protein (TIGR03066 family)